MKFTIKVNLKTFLKNNNYDLKQFEKKIYYV